MKSIYILLTKSNTYISKIKKLATNDTYTHASISFDDTLQPLYSFSRFQINMPLPAGLHMEPFDSGFFHKYPYLPCALYELKVEDEVYEHAKAEVDGMMAVSSLYHYNIMGLIFCRFNIPWKRKFHYFCSEFVSEILKKSNALTLPKEPSLMRPGDYTKMSNLTCLFEGELYDLIAMRANALQAVPCI